MAAATCQGLDFGRKYCLVLGGGFLGNGSVTDILTNTWHVIGKLSALRRG